MKAECLSSAGQYMPTELLKYIIGDKFIIAWYNGGKYGKGAGREKGE